MKIIVLDTTTKTICAALSSAVATSNPDFVVAYADTNDNTFSELSSDGQLNGTTDVTLVGAPASGVKRAIKSITIYNRDTAAVTVSIKFDNGGTQRILQRVQLVSGETWHSDELTKLSPGGSDTQVQFNDTGTLAGSSNFTYNKTTSVLTLGANPVLSGGTANGILYLNGSKVATTGSALTFDGTNFVLGTGGTSGSFPFTQRVSASASPVSAFRITNGSDATFDVTLQTSLASFGTGIGDLAFLRQGSEQMRLTSTGLGIGTSSPSSKLDVSGQIFGRSSFSTYTTDGLFSTDARPSKIITPGSGEASVRFGYADDGSGQYNPRIGFLNGSAATAAANSIGNDSSGNLVIGTGSTSATTRMWLTQSGNLGLGVTPSAWSSGYKAIEFGSGSIYGRANATDIYLSSNSYLGASTFIYKYAGAASYYSQALGGHYWFNAPSGTAGNAITFTQAMTLDASGNLLVGTTTYRGRLTVESNSITTAVPFDSNDTRADASSSASFVFRRQGTSVGSITTTTTATAYNTSSDYRLKDNPQPLTGSGAFIDALKPKIWNWKADGSRGVGFIAHEVQEVSPGSVSGEKDGEQMQAMEYGSAEFIANIIAELQSLRARVATLEGTQP